MQHETTGLTASLDAFAARELIASSHHLSLCVIYIIVVYRSLRMHEDVLCSLRMYHIIIYYVYIINRLRRIVMYITSAVQRDVVYLFI